MIYWQRQTCILYWTLGGKEQNQEKIFPTGETESQNHTFSRLHERLKEVRDRDNALVQAGKDD